MRHARLPACALALIASAPLADTATCRGMRDALPDRLGPLSLVTHADDEATHPGLGYAAQFRDANSGQTASFFLFDMGHDAPDASATLDAFKSSAVDMKTGSLFAPVSDLRAFEMAEPFHGFTRVADGRNARGGGEILLMGLRPGCMIKLRLSDPRGLDTAQTSLAPILEPFATAR
ncbi:hypothetical protein [Mesobacterium pallidum]|uniref:hypothetical protein n=1 Tax=Mesobacterium pallidum TaxID=2872037 RepID=UPI001EE25266|nr:hypothetical protein [Mesobacterium pallidum]